MSATDDHRPVRIRDRYEPVAVVGRGGQGEVVRAIDRMHDRPVALKMRVLAAPEERETVLQEARVLLGLRPHAALPLVREDFFEEDRYYLVMDWIEGESLREALAARNGSGLDVEHAMQALGQVAAALDHLHSHDPPIVHGDVKPANIIATPDGRTVLVDFGIATAAGASFAGGTPGFVAPELAAGDRPGVASDVFGLAATAFALLTGAPPRPGKRPRWRGTTKEQARRLDTALSRGLALDPARRPPSAGSLIAEMRGDSSPPTNLPVDATTFVGRETQRDEVCRLVGAARLVTITGSAGIGKTRLATTVAGELHPSFGDGVWLVELASLADPGLVPQAVAAALGVRETAGRALGDTIAEHLTTRHALVVLDNCEHLLDATAELAQRILASAREVRLLATSREPLGVDGETTWRLPPMGVPAEGAPAVEAAGAESVRLFVERARLIDPSFDPGGDGAVAAICRRLEGIPLAIELAAARTNLLSPREIEARLGDRFRILEGGRRRGAPARQTSLRAAVDWSYDLLDEAEREALNRLSVFAGGFTLEAAEAVCDAAALGLLSALVDKSLVVRDEVGPATRYRMLETIRAYAAERLDASKGLPDATRARHREWFASFAERASEELEGAEQARWLEAVEAEHDNLRAAIADGVRADPAVALRTAASLWRFWDVRGHLSEGRSWIEQALSAAAGASVKDRARALRALGVLALDQGDFAAATTTLAEGLALAREAGDLQTAGGCLNGLAIAAGQQGDLAKERALYEECLAIWRETGNRRGMAVALGNLGTVALDEGDPARARSLFDESLAIRRELGDRRGIAVSLNGLALAAGGLGDRDAERRCLSESLEIWRELGSRSGVAVALTNLGTVAHADGDVDAAVELLEEAVSTHRETGQRWNLADSLFELGAVRRSAGDDAAAAAAHLEALRLRLQIGDPRGTAGSLTALAGLALDAGLAEGAARLAAAAEALQGGASLPAAHESVRQADLERIRDILSPEELGRAWEAGSSLEPAEAASEAARLLARP